MRPRSCFIRRGRNDAIMVGANTIRIDNSFLTVRLVPGKSPLRVIPCSMADLPLDANVLGKDAPTAIAVCEAAPEDRIEAIMRKGAHVIVAGKNHVDLPLLLSLSLIHISEPTRRTPISYAVFCLKKKKKPIILQKTQQTQNKHQPDHQKKKNRI